MARRLRVDLRAALRMVGTLVKWFSLTLLIPLPVALYDDESARPFVATFALGLALGFGLERVAPSDGAVGVREGFLVVALAWLAVAAIGSLPYVFEGGDASRPVDAYFEAMSGFTTTGSTIIADVTSHGRAILFWRSLTQWIGGVGIVVFALAILPRVAGGRALMEGESPGPEFEKLSPRIRETARRVWAVYVIGTVLEIALLWGGHILGAAPRMDFYASVIHTFSTVSTGGFSSDPHSLADFGAYAQWVVIAFMVFGGSNLGLWFLAARRHRRHLTRDDEFRWYIGLMIAAAALVTIDLYEQGIDRSASDTIRQATFQVVSITTTTGFGSEDYTTFPALSILILIVLMVIGASSGSTGGALKVIRVLLVGKVLRRELAIAVHPEETIPVRVRRQVVSEPALRGALAFTVLYLGLFAIGTIALLVDASFGETAISPVEAIAASATNLGNVGGGITFFGPFGSSAPFSDLSTAILAGLMWLGRLELIPVLVLLTRSYWVR